MFRICTAILVAAAAVAAAAQPSVTPTHQQRSVFLRAVAEGVPGYPPRVEEQYASAADFQPFMADQTASVAGYMNWVSIHGVQQSEIFTLNEPLGAQLLQFTGRLSGDSWSDSGGDTGELGQLLCEIGFDVHPNSVIIVRANAQLLRSGTVQWFSVALYSESPTAPLHELVYTNQWQWSDNGWWEIDPGHYTLRVIGFIWPHCWNNPQVDVTFEVSAELHVRLDLPGDMNCDGYVNNFDIDAFVLDMLDIDLYVQTYLGCDPWKGDLNHDGAVNAFDIDPFVDLIVGTQAG
ncbi:MAG: hypothetical protein JNG88_17715 [Phycisphaerales bacterium]|nr:hypothetical protein [Phycisphaerales bacterium]